jgi:predicted nucleic acid-binding protein
LIVVDTNLLVYFWIQGPRTSIAEAVQRKDPVWLVRQETISLDVAHHLASQAERMMASREYDVISHRILALAARSRCSAYDCEFVVLAQELGVPLVTTDAQVLQAFPTVALLPEIFAAS